MSTCGAFDTAEFCARADRSAADGSARRFGDARERFQLGEGIDKPVGPDFAAEVAKVSGVGAA